MPVKKKVKPRKTKPRTELTPQMHLFVHHLLTDKKQSGTDAARKAGYKSPAQAAAKLMRDDRIIAHLGHLKHQREHRLGVKADDVLLKLMTMVMRSGADMIDQNTGMLLPLNKIPKNVMDCVDGIKQKVRVKKSLSGDDEGDILEVETEIKLSPLASAVNLAMQHFNLLGKLNQQDGDKITPFDWPAFLKTAQGKLTNDPIEKQIANPTKTITLPKSDYSISELVDDEYAEVEEVEED